MNIEEMKQGTDWRNAFDCAYRDGGRGIVGYTGSTAVCTLDDVQEVLAHSDGDNDGPNWIAALRLKDGRFVFLSAWCDATGFGCEDGGDFQFASSLNELVRWAMGNEDRFRLGYKLSWEDFAARCG